MRIRMLTQRSGPRHDGQDWPDRGGELDVTDDEGVALCAQGDAVPVAKGDSHVEVNADTADVEVRSAAKPIVNSPKSAWVDHAVSLGFDRDEAAGMSKADLIAAVKP